ncbi:hypothetical protein MBM_01039 [Drepanopeziza brunnea f. sp. 'multigermtubi' MB_m1]|uniref:Uncharacterized protein n=1 Tax=Marssonina brunnea f. sp. multigermtubi (strain MB_m1) TaxID=1072389 RepID=K1X5H1_MARBU|nr:uncharacterized protein MBM_01039 [Drepanopeziza brunnea f. sp. 'multigermtubi' MB_m1]EKD20357.1 hypothetical protein MBM_01039 [Drepanopeziza brunnea f. sp. 'multigermtubi' MB_m1]
MLQSKSFFPILLALSFLFDGAFGLESCLLPFWSCGIKRTQVIGYAKLPGEKAMPIILNNKLRVEKSTVTKQVGPGFYMLNQPVWEEDDDGSWYCLIKANMDKVKKADKVWIPTHYKKTNADGSTVDQALWDQEDLDNLYDFISYEAFIPEANKALLFSWVHEEGYWHEQMTIPTDVVNNDSLGIWATCFPSIHDLKKTSNKAVNWQKWDITTAGV